MKKLLFGTVVTLILGFLFWNIISNWKTISSYHWNFDVVNIWLLTLFLLPINFINATSWHLLLKFLGGPDLDYVVSLKVWMYSNAARFVPGTIWQYAGRMYLGSKAGIDKSLLGSALIFEALFNILLGFILSAFTITFLKIYQQGIQIIIFVSLVVIVVLISFISQKIRSKILSLLKIKFNLIWTPAVFFCYFLQFFFDGFVLYLLSQSVKGFPLEMLPVFIGIFAISWLTGYLAFFAPSGLGVQEVTLAFLLSTYMPFELASLLAIIFRLVLYLSEVISLGAIFSIDKLAIRKKL